MKRTVLLLLTIALVAVACSTEEATDAASNASNAVDESAPAATVASEDEVTSDTTSTTTTTAVPETTAPPTSALATEPRSLEPDCGAVGQVAVGLTSGAFVSGGNEYQYRWTVPSTYTGEPIPVVLDFHGLGSNGAQQAVFSGWAAKAEQEGFLSVQPTGLAPPGSRTSWELPQFDDAQRDDVRMVTDLLDLISANVCIDPARVYSTGMSNGGFFTSELVCDLSGRIAAAASVAGLTHHESCMPTRPVPFLAFHGTADDVVPFDGSGVSTLDPTGASSEFFSQVMPLEFEEFALDFGCQSSTDTAITAEVTLTSYNDCSQNVELGFYAVEGGGHTWPGSPVSAGLTSFGVTNTDINATDIAWEFFSRHSLVAG